MSKADCDKQSGGVALVALVILLALAGLAAYWYLTPDQAPAALRQMLRQTPLPQPGSTTVYRWRDEQGRWQISDRPPQGRLYEVLTYRHDANVVPAQAKPAGP
ncbi:MAG TPA: DUF4124 domain-containing protein [Candidatus Competibacteraceae bacterium]|nr:DUF4124 domain-containing protein [Candidatus Competibacteraceae bacterium]